MKKIKNALLLAIGSITVLAVAMTSCSKSSPTSTPTAPSITGTTGTVAPSSTITITGTGFTTGTTATINGTAVTVTFVSATAVTVVVPSTLSAGTYNLIVTVGGLASNVYSLTVGGSGSLATSDSVARGSLVAHFRFDGSSVEQGSGLAAGTTVGTVTYTSAGVIGTCASFTNGALLYPILPQLDSDNALESYSVSMWVNMPSNLTAPKWRSLFQLNANAYAGLLGILSMQLINDGVTGDTLPLQVVQTQVDGTGDHSAGFGVSALNNPSSPQIALTNPLNFADTSANGWTFLTMTYNGNGTNELLTVYANGVSIGSQTITDVTKPATLQVVPTGGNGSDAPPAWANYVTVGTFNFTDFQPFTYGNGYGGYYGTSSASVASYMSNGITGKIDDIRVFNTAISLAQVDSLYTFGKAGR